MKFDGPIQWFVYEGLHSNLKTISTDYFNITNKSFYNLLSDNQNMNDLPDDLLKLFAKKIRLLTDDHIMDEYDLIESIRGLLTHYDEMLLNKNYLDKDSKDKQLTYFSQQSQLFEKIITEMRPYIKCALFINKTGEQIYSLVFDKNIRINYFPAGQINQLGHSIITIAQDESFTWTFIEDELNITDLQKKLTNLQRSLNLKQSIK
ncbi:hypothetical protein D1B17_00400 [Companilactobacillus zhachilii]|jgi:hypothetical protein|uniref:Uncharacterized protein n=1 Tax=Companilactobacillus zhachilii TaxID=2304606 RepID=A0A386PPY8_9LACO|nr:hypothetical protein [Companilactobacillus zhachilii]AYE37202.1 hypothetical protein D1B17_00400 [Companilactobacillus zhachilii]